MYSLFGLFDDGGTSESSNVNILANRPVRAKEKKQPGKSLTLENIREEQLTDKEIARFLKWKDNSDIEKPALRSISSLGFESKFLYAHWELLTVTETTFYGISMIHKRQDTWASDKPLIR